MAKKFPGRLMREFDPALTDNGGAFVGMTDVGLGSVNVTIAVGTTGAYPGNPVLHSLGVAPTFWYMRPRYNSLLPFITWEAASADSSAIYYIAAYTHTNANSSAPATLYFIR